MKSKQTKTTRGNLDEAENAAGSLPNPLTIALGKNLRRYRKAANKTQIDLAYEAECERSRISKMECGYINPSLLTLASLCHSLKITLPELFTGIGETMAPVAEGGVPRRANQAVLEKSVPAGKRRMESRTKSRTTDKAIASKKRKS